jgi:CheY-like chemotaxis protein
MTEKSILLVEREEGIREILHLCLHDIGGWNVVVACSDREGLEQLAIAQPKPDAIIFDILLPEEKDGRN